MTTARLPYDGSCPEALATIFPRGGTNFLSRTLGLRSLVRGLLRSGVVPLPTFAQRPLDTFSAALIFQRISFSSVIPPLEESGRGRSPPPHGRVREGGSGRAKHARGRQAPQRPSYARTTAPTAQPLSATYTRVRKAGLLALGAARPASSIPQLAPPLRNRSTSRWGI